MFIFSLEHSAREELICDKEEWLHQYIGLWGVITQTWKVLNLNRLWNQVIDK